MAPALTGWQAHRHPFAFEPEMDYADGAWRWLGGTPVIPALFAATEGPRILREAGIDAVRAKSMRQTARLIELADARGYPVTAPRDAGAARRHGGVRRAARARGGAVRCSRATSSSTTGRARASASRRTSTRATTSSRRSVAMIDDILARDAWKRYTDERSSRDLTPRVETRAAHLVRTAASPIVRHEPPSREHICHPPARSFAKRTST